MNELQKERRKEYRRKLTSWAVAATFLFILYDSLMYMEAVFTGGDIRTALLTFLASLPILIFILLVYFVFPQMQRIPLYLAILTQIISLIAGSYLQKLTFYFFVMIIVVCVVSMVKNIKQMGILVLAMFVINLIALIFFIPSLEQIDVYRFFMQFVLFTYASLFMLIQTFNVVQKESNAEHALLAFSSLLNRTPNYMVITDSQSRVSYISQPMVEFTHYSKQKYAVGQPLIDLFSDKALKLMFADILNANGFVEKVMTINIEGKERHFKVVADKLSDDTGGLFIDIFDITQLEVSRKAAEEANVLKSTFLAKMSHEIRTPMNAIIGMAELALRKDMPNNVREDVVIIKQSGVNLLGIINDILDFSKIESRKLEIVPTDYLFSSLVNDVVSIIRMRIIDSKLRFVVNLDGSIPNALYGDETRIRQVLLNILSNAVKYTKEGFVSFSVGGEVIDDAVLLTIDVVDSGIGIKPEDMKKLFGNFVQLDLATNKGVEGTGLGLAITKNITEAMGGSISVASEYGDGSTFTISLAQKIRSHDPIAEVENPKEKSVLVYDSSQIYTDSIICAIDTLGVYCTYAVDDEEFREKLKAENYSFVFVEFLLLDNVRKIISEVGSKAKIVLITGFGDAAIADKDCSILAMPVHSISVANILNGVSESFSYSTSETIAKFVAPRARILVVDDINTNLKIAEGLLQPYKMQVDLCLSGAEAIELVKQNNYDIVFMDHMMPEMDGVEATKFIREFNQSLPVVALTANAVFGVKDMFLSSGFNDFLSKPIDTIKLDAVLKKWLPEEKREKSVEESINKSDSVESMEIDGIDVKKGISMSGGKIENYKKILSIFARDGIQKISEIEKCLKTDNLPLYTTYVHALKSASANVGATRLSEMAAALEKAGKQEDLAFIQNHNAKLISSLSTLIENISGELKVDNQDDSPKKAVDKTLLESEFAKLAEAIESMDLRAIKTAIKAIQPLTDGTDAAVEDILQNAKIGEYEKALCGIKGNM